MLKRALPQCTGELALLILSIASAYAVSCPGPESWNETVFLLHEDCHKFYKCVFGQPIEMSCSAGLYFNLETSQCDWKENVDCPNDVSEEQGSQFLENGCPRDSSVHWLLPHENDCNLFYTCVSGRKLKRSCPGSLHFDFEQQICGWPKPEGCDTSNEDSSSEIDSPENNPSKEDNSIEDNTKEDISKEDDSKEDVTKEDSSSEGSSENNPSKEDNSIEDNTEENISKEDDSKEDISKEDDSKEDSSSEGSSENNSSEGDITIEEFSEEDISKENDTKENNTKEDDSNENDSKEDISNENNTNENDSKESISNEDTSNEEDSSKDSSEEKTEEDTSNDDTDLRSVKKIEAIVHVNVLKSMQNGL